jgi:hypothetical protein
LGEGATRRRRGAPVEGGAEDRTGGRDIFTAKERRAAPEEEGDEYQERRDLGPELRSPSPA